MLDRALTAAERDEIGKFLGGDGAPDDRLPGVAADGFITGVLCSPTLHPPSRWLPIVTGESDEAAFDDVEQARRITTLIMRWYNEIARALAHDPENFAPAIADESGALSPGAAIIWAMGFGKAMNLDFASWDPLVESDAADRLDPIFALLACVEEREDWDARARAAAMDLPASVCDIYDYWLQRRTQPFRRSAPKIGPNAACPCGSGRKFKRCCGAVA